MPPELAATARELLQRRLILLPLFSPDGPSMSVYQPGVFALIWLPLLAASCSDLPTSSESGSLDALANPTPDQQYLINNAKKEGVVTLPSGLQYKILREGDGEGASPKKTDRVRVHYQGRLVNGTEFDSSYARNQPAEFALGRVIPGWTEGLQLMKVGQRWELCIPAELGYGKQGAPPVIPGDATLIFEVELLDILD
ncbi:MAG: FKBP-type peptidyl-prolyl cis-trans isomerase [Planctomycetota bacterium]|nr:MAG: FKBP-type peptidyl-prolyl cis-trans isomerase [Planctomycetota bacterium]REJ95806.1 MAG: FKBP-type peptidyl-prolyl cis-trans isomerase [Planctomycetota bacterium]REK25381.1 MAG: FKBP-type peptidyl-prolyl cis-trans isomerase [Planctomycetota bacterium]REK43518.1 MAG: FKBP-type peptidyl-prolyl cis-trans isomerase [Planctomycetota bacterium]